MNKFCTHFYLYIRSEVVFETLLVTLGYDVDHHPADTEIRPTLKMHTHIFKFHIRLTNNKYDTISYRYVSFFFSTDIFMTMEACFLHGQKNVKGNCDFIVTIVSLYLAVLTVNLAITSLHLGILTFFYRNSDSSRNFELTSHNSDFFFLAV